MLDDSRRSLLFFALIVLQGSTCVGCALGEPYAQAAPRTTADPTQQQRPAPSQRLTVQSKPPPGHRAATPLRDADIDWTANPVMKVLGRIAQAGVDLKYSATTRVDETRGRYHFDCSGMTQWVLRKAAPVAAQAAAWKLPRRPLAADYARRIAKAPSNEPKHGWQRIESLEDARPGDVIAWVKPKIIQSRYTGHVAFIALPPVRVTGYSDAYLVRVIDSTSLLHHDDTRQDHSGFGLGTILLVVDTDTGAPRAYGWVGLQWRAFETQIAIGRPVR